MASEDNIELNVGALPEESYGQTELQENEDGSGGMNTTTSNSRGMKRVTSMKGM